MTRGLPLSVITLALLTGCHGRDLELCDIAQSDCQQDVYYADLRLRGDGYDPFGGIPPIRTISEDQYRAELEERAASSPRPAVPWWDAALPLLHLLPSTGDTQSTSIDNQVQNTAAYYSSATREVTVIRHRSQALDENTLLVNMDILAHELVHALQDRELDLNPSPTSTDGDFARSALIEGDASLYDYLFPFPVFVRFEVNVKLEKIIIKILKRNPIQLQLYYNLSVAAVCARRLPRARQSVFSASVSGRLLSVPAVWLGP